MKLNSKVIWALLAGMLLGSQAWAEKGMTQMEERADSEREMPAMSEQHEMMDNHDEAHENMQGAQHEAMHEHEEAMQDAVTNEPVLMEQSGFSRGSVVRSVFTTAVEDREPTDNIKELSTDSDKVIYYTELRDMAGQTAKHRWEHNGEVMAEVEFKVGGSRWRVWSSKSFVPGWTGEWKVSVLNGANEVISEDVLTYAPATAEPEAAPAPVENTQVQ